MYSLWCSSRFVNWLFEINISLSERLLSLKARLLLCKTNNHTILILVHLFHGFVLLHGMVCCVFVVVVWYVHTTYIQLLNGMLCCSMVWYVVFVVFLHGMLCCYMVCCIVAWYVVLMHGIVCCAVAWYVVL